MLTKRWLAKTGMFIGSALFALCTLTSGNALANQQVLQTPLPGKSIPKFVEPLPVFGPAGPIPRVAAGSGYTVSMEEFDQQVLPAPNPLLGVLGYPKTTVWGYRVGNAPLLYPGVTVEAQQGVAATVTYVNNLIGPFGAPPKLQKYLTVDQTLHWADPLGLMCTMTPTSPACMTPYGNPTWVGPGNPLNPPGAPVPTVAHLHGAEVQSNYDGGPEQWFTPTGQHGPSYASLAPVLPNQAQFFYPNTQEATTLWFHDHALGVTRLNVYGGLAAFYLLRDSRDTGLLTNPIALPAGPQEIELAIQDRMFDTTGQWLFPDLGINPLDHPFWIPEFFGDTIVVNGKSWPYLNVEQRRYRFRVLDGSNARFYQMALVNQVTGLFGPPIWQIGTDGGLLDAPVILDDPALLNAGVIKPNFIMAPGERADIIIDFSNVPVGTTFVLKNIAKAPFPHGAPADPQTVGQIMQFRVAGAATTPDTSCNPALLPPAAGACNLRATPIVRLVNPTTGTPAVTPTVKRQLTLKEVQGMAGPLEVLVNNTKWNGINASTMLQVPGSFASSYVTPMGFNWLTEGPRVGATEMWEIINLTADAHPIHLHLVQFQLINRQPFQTSQYLSDWSLLFPGGVSIPGFGPPLPYNVPNADGAIGGNLAVTSYLQGLATPPNPNEAGWKDTVIMHPGEVSRIMVRWAPQNTPIAGVSAGINLFPFDPTAGPGYVWHCHIIDHEDNEMMRPYAVMP